MSQVNNLSENNENCSLFSNESNVKNEETNPENQIEKKYLNRQNKFIENENFTKIKEAALKNELNLRHNDMMKLFNQRRIFQKKKYENLDSLKNKIKIPIELFEESQNITIDYNQIGKYFADFFSNDISLKYKSLVCLKKILLSKADLNEEEIAKIKNEIHLFSEVQFLNDCFLLLNNSYPEFQYEALLCLNGLINCVEEYSNFIVSKGGLNIIIKLFDSDIIEIQENSISLAGNLMIQNPEIISQFISLKGFQKLTNILSNSQNSSIITQTLITISNCIKFGSFDINYNIVKPLIKPLARTFLFIKNNDKFISEATWLLGSLSEKYYQIKEEILQSGIIPIIISLINKNSSKYVILSSLRIIGNIITGNANQTQEILNLGILNILKETLFHDKSSIRKETAWILSNICSGTQKQIEMIIDNGFFELFIKCIKNDSLEVKNEIIWAITNLTIVNNFDYLNKIVDLGIVEIICSFLKEKTQNNIIVISLEALGNLLAYGKKNSVNEVNEIVKRIENGENDLKQLQFHSIGMIYEKALFILEKYFDT